jgi:hypothetical protein
MITVLHLPKELQGQIGRLGRRRGADVMDDKGRETMPTVENYLGPGETIFGA